MYPMKQQQYISPKHTSRIQSPYQSPVKKVLATVSRNNVDCQNLEDCLPLLLQVQRQRQEDTLQRQQHSPGEVPGGPLIRPQPQIRPQQSDAQIAVITRQQRGNLHQRGGNRGGPNQQLLRGGPQSGNAAGEGETSGTSCDEDCEEEESRKPKKPLYRRVYSYVREAWTGVKSALDSELEDLETPPRYRPDSLESLCRATRFSPAEIKKIYRGFKAECPTGVVKEETFKMIYARFFPQGDSELEDLETPPRYRPDSLESLCRATRFSPAEIKKIYRGFKAECPTGVVKEETFKMIYARFFPQGANSGQYAHYVFNTLDQDHSGLISFEDFVQNLSILSRGSLEEKLRWAFSLYDINGDGCITREEMTDIVSSVYELMGKLAEPCIDEDTVKEKVDRIFQKMDKNQDGVVTLDEFLDCCKSDKDISASMAVFDPYM